jgi:hypothetical protein
VSHYDYGAARALPDVPFRSLLMAAALKADSTNLGLLREAWPDICAEAEMRYNAPGGYLPGEQQGGQP